MTPGSPQAAPVTPMPPPSRRRELLPVSIPTSPSTSTTTWRCRASSLRASASPSSPSSRSAPFGTMSSSDHWTRGGDGRQEPSRPWSMLVAPPGDGIRERARHARVHRQGRGGPSPAARPLTACRCHPLGLLEALHYLDITSQRHCRRPLVQVNNPVAAGTLTFDVSGAAEFQARLSALAGLLKALQTHSARGVDGTALVRLSAYLTQHLDADDDDAAAASIQILIHLMNIRHGQQHSSAAPDALEAWRPLRLTYPPRDWNIAGQQIRSVATDAVMDLRDQMEVLPIDGCIEHRRPRACPPTDRSGRPGRSTPRTPAHPQREVPPLGAAPSPLRSRPDPRTFMVIAQATRSALDAAARDRHSGAVTGRTPPPGRTRSWA